MTRFHKVNLTALAAVTALSLASMACPHPPQPLPEPDVVIVPMGPEGAAPATCATACVRLRDLGCREGFGFDGGDSCERVCQHVIETGVTDIAIDCIAAAKSTDEVHACRVRCVH